MTLKTKQLLECHRQMLQIRLVEEKIAALHPEQEMRCPIHLSVGQEAVPVGVCSALKKDDYAVGNHRSHGYYLARGGSLKAMMAELYGKADGCAGGKGGSMHLIDLSVNFLGAAPIVSGTIPIAVGVAMGSVMKGEKQVSVAFFGDAATEEGVFYESINFALLKKLPVVFVCENNFYSTHSPLSVRQPKGREIFEMAKGLGIFSFHGDGNNVEEVYELANKAIERTRKGLGPSFLEFKTYRWFEHCGPNYDHELGYRTKKELIKWKQKCPIVSLEKRLTEQNISTKVLEKIREGVNVEIEEAVIFAKQSSFPDEARVFEDIYAN